jgi:polyhydroxyalkanoate synthesis regulator protein
MARVTRSKATKCFASRRLCNTATGTSVTGEGLVDVVLAILSTEIAALIARPVLQTARRHMRHD